MSQNSNGPEMVVTPRVRESSAVAAAPMLPHAPDNTQPLTARPLVLITRGRIEYTAKCPGCASWHRHRHLGDVRGPCGTEYELQRKAKRGAA
jgi:hypothetical protein